MQINPVFTSALNGIIKPKRPVDGNGWIQVPSRVGEYDPLMKVFPPEAWQHTDGFYVMSGVEKPVLQPGEVDLGPEYHISITRNQQRCMLADAMWVLAQFGVSDAKEDNHFPSGIVRNFWRPVADRFSGYECPCQDSEPAMREDKGDFVWRGVPR